MNPAPSLARLLAGLLLLAMTLASPAQLGPIGSAPPKVSATEIRHVGPRSVSDAFIRANIRVRPGDPYQRPAVDDDIRNLYATGLFLYIRVGEEFTNSSLILTYVVNSKTLI